MADDKNNKNDQDSASVVANSAKALEIQLEMLKTQRQIKQEISEEARIRAELSNSAGELSKHLDSQEQNYKVIDEQIQAIKNNSEGLVDQEEILEQLGKVRLERLKKEFQINQQAILLKITELENQKKLGKDGEEKAKQLEEELKVLKEKAKLQGKEIADTEKQKQLKENILSLGKQILESAKQNTLELEKHIMNISKLNGGYAEFGGQLREANMQIYQGTAGTGIMFEEANAAFAGLSQNFIGLTTQSEKSISQMVKGAAQLTKLGVDASSATKSMDSLVNSMGKTPAQAIKIQDSFVQMSAKNRLALSAVSQAFAENSSRFVGYGEKMTDVLAGLAEQSLQTGVSISKLVSIAQQFDTFEGAAKAVGNLNALLGGDYLNSIELLTASDDERIRLLKEAVAASGMQFESMNRFQQMAVANAAGINDLNEASKIFGQTSLHNTKKQEEAAKVQKTLAEQAESVSTSMDKMKSALNSLIIVLDPLVSLFGLLATVISYPAKHLGELGEEMGGFGGKVLSVIGSLISVFIVIISYVTYLAIKNRILGGSWNFIASSIAKATAKLAQWKALNAAGPGATPSPAAAVPTTPAAGPAGPGRFMSFINTIQPGKLLAAAAALVLVAAALFIMAKALQEFATIASGGRAGAIGLAVGSLVALVGALVLMNTVQAEVIKGSIIVGIMALVLLGFGIALSKFINIDWKIIAGIGIILVALTLAILGIGLALSGPQALLFKAGIIVIGVMAVTLGLLGFALSAIVKSIESAAPAITNLANSFKALFELKDLKDNFSSLESFLSQLSNIDIEPINNLANAIYNLATNLEALAAIPSNMGVNVTGTADLKSVIDQTVANAAQTTNVVSKAASSAATQTLIPAQQTTAFVPLVVQIDKKTIIEILKEDIKNIAKGQTSNKINTVGRTDTAFDAIHLSTLTD